MKHYAPSQLFKSLLKRLVVGLPLLLCLLALAGVNNDTQAATLHSSAVSNAALGTSEQVYATHVNVHSAVNCPRPNTRCPVIARINAGTYTVFCQKQGQLISDHGVSSRWWSLLSRGKNREPGWVSNVYIKGPAKLPGVPPCS